MAEVGFSTCLTLWLPGEPRHCLRTGLHAWRSFIHAGRSPDQKATPHKIDEADLNKLLGKLKFRTANGQNLWSHSVETASIAGMMASELGLNPALARRAGLLHDIGKAVEQEADSVRITKRSSGDSCARGRLEI